MCKQFVCHFFDTYQDGYNKIIEIVVNSFEKKYSPPNPIHSKKVEAPLKRLDFSKKTFKDILDNFRKAINNFIRAEISTDEFKAMGNSIKQDIKDIALQIIRNKGTSFLEQLFSKINEKLKNNN